MSLRAAHFARPLYVLVAAYLLAKDTTVDVDALDERDLLRTLLAEHAADHWARWAERRRLDLDPADQRVAVALTTLLAAADEADGERSARRAAAGRARRCWKRSCAGARRMLAAAVGG